jgi:hypothetical protein
MILILFRRYVYVVEETLLRQAANYILRIYKIFVEIMAELQLLPVTGVIKH